LKRAFYIANRQRPPTRRSFKEGDIVCLRADESYVAYVTIPYRPMRFGPESPRRRMKVLWAGGHQQWVNEDDYRYPDAVMELGRLA